jgi:hypothetical protein
LCGLRLNESYRHGWTEGALGCASWHSCDWSLRTFRHQDTGYVRRAIQRACMLRAFSFLSALSSSQEGLAGLLAARPEEGTGRLPSAIAALFRAADLAGQAEALSVLK